MTELGFNTHSLNPTSGVSGSPRQPTFIVSADFFCYVLGSACKLSHLLFLSPWGIRVLLQMRKQIRGSRTLSPVRTMTCFQTQAPSHSRIRTVTMTYDGHSAPLRSLPPPPTFLLLHALCWSSSLNTSSMLRQAPLPGCSSFLILRVLHVTF